MGAEDIEEAFKSRRCGVNKYSWVGTPSAAPFGTKDKEVAILKSPFGVVTRVFCASLCSAPDSWCTHGG